MTSMRDRPSSRTSAPEDAASSAPSVPSGGRASISDVARHAGVSTATVSRVLNRPSSVKADKRQAVLQSCEALGYVINGAARALSSNRTYTIGAVVPTLATQTFSRTLNVFQKRLHDAGYTLLLASSDFDPSIELDEVTKLLGHGVDALMVVGRTHDPKMWERIDQRGVPCVQILTLDSTRPSIGYDNTAIGHLIADHLIQLGHTDISVIVGTPPTNDRVADRIRGMRKRLASSGATLPRERIVDNAFSLNEARAAAMKMLEASNARPTAIVCGNDQLAFGVLLAAAAKGLRVPEDLSIVGFNNYDFAAHLTPALTTVSVDLAQLGAEAADFLLRAIDKNAVASALPRIETALIVRGSTAPAPAKAPRRRQKSTKAATSTIETENA
ncbi:LacI family DNA-binding transcriptional regulator [Paraburkholderia tropica]|uniref:LacI family DNA-binding transcriptional regulator n=1 Tax=Paraburkholderia tropica TaxID=92647 RepID=UPI0031333EC0